MQIIAPVFKRFKWGLGERTTVAEDRAAQRRHHAHRLQGGQHGSAFHRVPVVGIQHDSLGADVFPQADVVHNLANWFTVIGLTHLPADSFLAENIQKELDVKVAACGARGQVGDVAVQWSLHFPKHKTLI